MAGVESSMKCMVCNESDGARHYGSICCSGCKGFFRRTVRFKRVYECPYGRKCVIEKEYRNCCRACRYDKCIQVGLNPMLVHGDRGYARSRLQELPDNLDAQLVKVKTEVPSTDFLIPKTEAEDSVPKPHPVDLGPDTFNEVLLQTSRIRMTDLDELPLGVKHALPRFSPTDVRSIAKYFVFAESDSVGQSSDDLHKYNIDVPASVAFRKPGAICPRFPVDWRPSKVSTAANFRKNYLRIIAHFFDWASHIPELELLSETDKELLVLSRCIPCSWLLMGHRTAIYDADGILVTAGDYFPENGKDVMDAE
ncbi:zinc finger protein [Aphelenchoides avenae]|nr:zinc finger protein [Aphelenchus avenae]